MSSLPLDSIIIDRDSRQRRNLNDIEGLAASIARIGLLHPPVVERETNRLVAGERRLTAIRILGWTDCPVTFLDSLDEFTRQSIELEENLKRTDLSWQDTVAAVTRYHQMQAAHDPTWNTDRTAEQLGMSKAWTSECIVIAGELSRGNTMVQDAPKRSVALGIARRARERRGDDDLGSMIVDVATQDDATAATPVPATPAAALDELVESAPALDFESLVSPRSGLILNEDFNEWAPRYTGKKFNLIHCDFPYGIDADKFNQGSAAAHGGYADSPEVYWQLIDTLINNLDRFAEESCHLVFWFSMDFYTETRALLSREFRVDKFPLVWFKSDGRGILPDPNRGPRRNYETAFLCSRGDRKIVRAVSNVAPAPITSGTHMSEKTQSMLEHFMRMLVDESSSVLDPTCGSGSSLRAAHACGAQRFLGLEVNPEFAELADQRLQEAFDE